MVDHKKVEPEKYKDVVSFPKNWQEAGNHHGYISASEKQLQKNYYK
jgi:hypothetical protein